MAKRGGGAGKPRGRAAPARSRTQKERTQFFKKLDKARDRIRKQGKQLKQIGKQLKGLSWQGSPVLGPFDRPLAMEAEFAAAYTRKWHAVHDWAAENTIGDVTLRNGDPRRRSSEGLLVRDVDDSEEAGERGIMLQDMHLAPGPGKDEGGIRRVVIRLLTWEWDVSQQSAYKPQWGTFGTGLTVREAVAQFNRYVRNYRYAIAKGIESRRLVVTGMSIVYWTSSPKELNYV